MRQITLRSKADPSGWGRALGDGVDVMEVANPRKFYDNHHPSINCFIFNEIPAFSR
jgi:hypothetical protein